MSDDTLEDLLADFVLEARERISRVESLLLALADGSAAERPDLLQQARRELHTLKGNSGMMGLEHLRALAHDLEDRLESHSESAPEVGALLASLDTLRGGVDALLVESAEAPRPGHDVAAPSLRLTTGRLDALLDLLADQVVLRNRLGEAIADAESRGPAGTGGRGRSEVVRAWEALERNLEGVKDRLLELGMVALGSVYPSLKRIVHDEAAAAGKRVRLDTRGGQTAIDRGLIEFAADALGHLVRNAVVHGIESAAERAASGKPDTGTVRVEAAIHSDAVNLQVSDDGAGIDRRALRRAAERLGLEAPGERDLHSLVFLPGLSTRTTADLSAGRGIGLAAVAQEAHRLGGSIEVASESGAGTTFRLRLPISTSITRALLLRADGEEYALPVSAVIETLRLAGRPATPRSVAWRGHRLPLLDLGLGLGTSPAHRPRELAVVVEAEGRIRGLAVDATGEIRQIVVKKLDPVIGRPAGISGATVLGDGRVILILDPGGLTTLTPDAALEELTA